jgi:hypothetical protein
MKGNTKFHTIGLSALVMLVSFSNLAKAETPAAPLQSLPHKEYVDALTSSFGRRVLYATEDARKKTTDYKIDCHAADKRGLRLSTLLLARAASASQPDMWLMTVVEAKGDEIRVYDHLVKSDGAWVTEPTLRMEIDQWGDLTPYGIRAEAILNSCFGSYGPIWE